MCKNCLQNMRKLCKHNLLVFPMKYLKILCNFMQRIKKLFCLLLNLNYIFFRRKNKEQRENVIGELIMTEREFCRDLKLTWQAFGLETPDLLEQRGIEVQGLFGNLSDIIEISSKFLENLTEDPENIGKNFCNHSESMKKGYTDYCINHDKAEQLLEKYEAIPDVQKLLQKSVETLQAQVVCFNMGSILIKPVQRILKYPLILNELLKVR